MTEPFKPANGDAHDLPHICCEWKFIAETQGNNLHEFKAEIARLQALLIGLIECKDELLAQLAHCAIYPAKATDAMVGAYVRGKPYPDVASALNAALAAAPPDSRDARIAELQQSVGVLTANKQHADELISKQARENERLALRVGKLEAEIAEVDHYAAETYLRKIKLKAQEIEMFASRDMLLEQMATLQSKYDTLWKDAAEYKSKFMAERAELVEALAGTQEFNKRAIAYQDELKQQLAQTPPAPVLEAMQKVCEVQEGYYDTRDSYLEAVADASEALWAVLCAAQDSD